MTKDQAKKGKRILDLMDDNKLNDSEIRKLHTAAESGDSKSLDKLANAALELNGRVMRSLENDLSRI